ncbi:conserved unknown protein [Ectocarpus siliculosus]|uniref:Uncharacterized protein n=1 Tax=Ectocarpus siliculosus TaxID=2880 RepID=D7FT39_ECTSI|nr:conserved unknown protein [Ectocarpus siliculosus]|eukprot:CBJ31330.1 conserved unknown protein [Ectocarpus siliculosus]
MAGSQGKALGVRSCVASTFRNEGIRAFYKGMAFPLAAQVVFKAVIFTTNGIARRALDRRGLADSPAGVYACGALGGGVNSFIVTPVELVRTRLMLQYGGKPASSAGGGGGGGDGRLRGPLDCVRQVVRRNGVFGMWQGLRVTLTRDSLGMGAFFLAFDTVKRALAKRRYDSSSISSGELSGKRPPDFDHLLVAGSTAGLCFWLVALPLDMTKTVIQAAGRKRGEVIPGGVATLSRLFREGGLRNLYMGWPVAFGRGIPGAAIMLATHTFASQKLADYSAATTSRPPPAAAAAVAAVAKRPTRTNRMG